MTPSFSDLIDDIEQLKGKKLRSIKEGAELKVVEVDRARERIDVCSCRDGNSNSRPFSELNKIWSELTAKALTDEPWIHVESVLGGSGSRRNQPETLLINLPYIVYCWHRNKKHIAFVAQDAHQLGTTLEMTEEEINSCLSNYRKAAHENSLHGKPHNWIFFGAPGTGKSHQLDELARKTFSEKNIRRVTLYPDYTYSQFVGGYKPSPLYDKNGRPTSEITYRFIPGPFMLSYIQAVQNPTEPYLLIIEEINRANPAAVFGDVFQLLDRNEKGRSVYEITVPREMEDYLRIHLPEYATTAHIPDPEQLLAEQTRLDEETTRLSLPPNMYIWATMNSADQGVYPMDTAFKRRWDFKYIGINDGADAVIDGIALNEIEVPCGTQNVKWNDLRIAINNFLLTDSIHVNEDKLLGPFFIAPASLAPEKFTQVFENKVLMYLYEDAGKSKRSRLFRSDLKTYSQICDVFETEGTAIFGDGFAAPKPCTEKQADTDDADSSEE